MASTLDQFSRVITRVGNRVERNVGLLVRRTAFAVHQSVTIGTPVDTGRARSNWLVGINVPRGEQIGARNPGSGLGVGESGNASATLSEGKRLINRFQIERDFSIFITNNVPYVSKLNEGSSAQAPAGFVEAAVRRGRAIAAAGRVLGGL